MSILKQIEYTIHAGINKHRHDIIFQKMTIILQKVCNIPMSVDDFLFVFHGKDFNSLDYVFKFGTISLNWQRYSIKFTFNKELVDVEHSIPHEMSNLTVDVDGDLNLIKARYIKRFTVGNKEDNDQFCNIYLTYNVSKKLKQTTQVQYTFNHYLYDCFNLKNLINPCMFLRNKQMFNETLMEFLIQCSTNTDMFYQLFDKYPSVIQHANSCEHFFNVFIKQYKTDLATLKDNLLTLKMYSL